MNDFRNPSIWSCDTSLGGRLRVCQSRQGYRFSIDALILAFHAVPLSPRERILDLGTGCGIIPLVMAYRFPDVAITGVEIQPELAALARFNVEENGFAHRIAILEDDYLRLRADAIDPPVDMVVANPPYRKPHSGRINPHHQRALARHEIAVSLKSLIQAIRRFLKTGGRAWMIYTVDRLPELMDGMQAHNLAPKYLRMIHSRRDADAKRCLLKVIKGAKSGLAAGPPLVIYQDAGQYTDEAASILGM